MKPLEKLRFVSEEDGLITIISGRFDELGEPVSEARCLSRETANRLYDELSSLLNHTPDNAIREALKRLVAELEFGNQQLPLALDREHMGICQAWDDADRLLAALREGK